MESGTGLTTILVTGGAGFIGSNFVPYWLNKYDNYRIVNLDKLTYAGNLANLEEVAHNPRYKFIAGDICNRDLVEFIFREWDVQGVIHFAAESHVDNSILGPDVFIKTNISGTFTLLDVARKFWLQGPHQPRHGYAHCRFHHVSTDEVYGSLGPEGLFTEETRLAPNSPYSASKASSDMLVRSYFHTYGLNVVTTNCSNNYGPKQHAEKLIPTIIRKAMALETIPIYGDGKNIRDWLYVLDHCRGVDTAFHNGRSGETYNLGGKNELQNIYIAGLICDLLDERVPERLSGLKSFKELIKFVTDRPGHDRRYAIDATKVERELGWEPQETFESGIVKTVDWYVNTWK
ncbi:MAG: dTDP-glucose 4,6-dehydratase [Peptococcaceae bacterium]|nr:dTDP-glucose 4,6-dehydratase [Peptococcaceae bacterium]